MRDFSNRDPPRAPKALLDTREPGAREPPSGPRANGFPSDFRGSRGRGRGRGWYDDARADRGRDIDRDYRDRRDDRPPFRDDRGRDRDWFDRDRRDRESFRGRRPTSPGRGRGRGRGDYDFYSRGRAIYDDRSRFRGRSRSPEIIPRDQRSRRQSLAMASPPPPVVPAFGTVLPTGPSGTPTIPTGPKGNAKAFQSVHSGRHFVAKQWPAPKNAQSKELKSIETKKKKPERGLIFQQQVDSAVPRSKTQLTHVTSDDDEVDSEDELDDDYFQDKVVAVQAAIEKDAFSAPTLGVSMISTEEIMSTNRVANKTLHEKSTSESIHDIPITRATPPNEIAEKELGLTGESKNKSRQQSGASNRIASYENVDSDAHSVAGSQAPVSRKLSEHESGPLPSVEDEFASVAAAGAAEIPILSNDSESISIFQRSMSRETLPSKARSASVAAESKQLSPLPTSIQAPQPVRKSRMATSVPPPDDEKDGESEAEYQDQLRSLQPVAAVEELLNNKPLLETKSYPEQIAAVRPQIKTPPISSLPFAPDPPGQTAWDNPWAMGDDLSPGIKKRIYDNIFNSLREKRIKECTENEELAREYKRRYKAYLLLHKESQEPWVVRSRQEWTRNLAAKAGPTSNAPAAVETRPEGRRNASRFATEHDLARILKESEREAREVAERESRAEQAKAASEKEADIPDMLSAKDREIFRFPDRTGLIPEDRVFSVYQVLPPIDNFDEEEKEIFIKTMLEYPKQWTKIAAALPNRDYKACIQHYYLVKHEVGFKELLAKPKKGRRKGKNAAKPKSNALMENFKPGDTETEDAHDNMETIGERRRPRRAAAPTFTSEKPPSESENNTPAPKPERRGAGAKKDNETGPVKRRGKAPAKGDKAKQAKTNQAPVSRSVSKGREDDKTAGVPRLGQTTAPRVSSSTGYYQPQPWDDMTLVPPTNLAPEVTARYSATTATEPTPTTYERSASFTAPSTFSVPTSFPQSVPVAFATPTSFQTPQPATASTHGESAQQPYAQERMGSLPPSGAYDSQPKRTNLSQTSSYWSVPDQTDFPALLVHFGTDWAAIAKWMGTKTHIMVYLTIFEDWFTRSRNCKTNRGMITNIQRQVKNYYQRQVDQGRTDLQEIARRADEKKARGESTGAPPVPTVPIKRKYDGPPGALPRPLSSVIDVGEEPLMTGHSSTIPKGSSPAPPQTSRFPVLAQASPTPQPIMQQQQKHTPQAQSSPHIQPSQQTQQIQQPPQQIAHNRQRGPTLGYFNPDRERPILQASVTPPAPSTPLSESLRSKRSAMVAQEAQMEKEQAQRLERQQQQARQMRKQERERQDSVSYEPPRSESVYCQPARNTPGALYESPRLPVQAQPSPAHAPALGAVRQQETVRKTSSIMSLLNDEPSEPRAPPSKPAVAPVQPSPSPAQQQSLYPPPSRTPSGTSSMQYPPQHQAPQQPTGPARAYTPIGFGEQQPTMIRRQYLQQQQQQGSQPTELSSPYQQPIQQIQQPMYQQAVRAQAPPIRREASLGEMHSASPYQPSSVPQGSMRLVDSPYSSMPQSQQQQVRQQEAGPPPSERDYHQQQYMMQHQQPSHRSYVFGQGQASHQTAASPTTQSYGFNFGPTPAATSTRHGSFDARQGPPLSHTPPSQQPYPPPPSQQPPPRGPGRW